MPLTVDTSGLPEFDGKKVASAMACRLAVDSARVANVDVTSAPNSGTRYLWGQERFIASNQSAASAIPRAWEADSSMILCYGIRASSSLHNPQLFLTSRNPQFPAEKPLNIGGDYFSCVPWSTDPHPPYSLAARNLSVCKHEFVASTSTRYTIPANPSLPTRETTEWLDQIKRTDEAGPRRAAVRAVFQGLIPLIERGAASELDAVLASVKPAEFSTETGLAFLAITIRVADPLPSRKALVDRVRDNLARTRGPEEVLRLMQGLDG